MNCTSGSIALTAVDALNLDVQAGRGLRAARPNGAGKTTTIKMLITLLPPSGGSASVAGHDILHDPRLVRRSIGYVPQLLSSDGALSARENLMTSARLYHLPDRRAAGPDRRGPRVHGPRDRPPTGSSGPSPAAWSAASRSPRPCSTGPRSSSSTSRPSGWIPTPGERCGATSASSARREGTTILLTTHYMDEAAELCGRVGFMHLGKLVALGTPEELSAQAGKGKTLDDAFTYFTGSELSETGEQGGQFRDVARTRRTARRLG